MPVTFREHALVNVPKEGGLNFIFPTVPVKLAWP
jgi:hypothetical protein